MGYVIKGTNTPMALVVCPNCDDDLGGTGGYCYDFDHEITCDPRGFEDIPFHLQALFQDSDQFWAFIGSVEKCACRGDKTCPSARFAARIQEAKAAESWEKSYAEKHK